MPENSNPIAPRGRHSIGAQISEVERELTMRSKVYPRMKYGPGHTFARRSEANLAEDIMRAARETLLWAKENRQDVIDWIRAGKPKAKPSEAA